MKQNFVSYQVVEPVTYISFAVYSADDGSLNFYHRPDTEMPAAGDTFENKTVTAVYTGFETASYDVWSNKAPWLKDYVDSITSATVVDEGIAPKSLAAWFSQCKNLTDFSLDKLDRSAVTNMRYMFNGCTSLSDLSPLTSWDTSAVTDVSYMFSYCTSLADLSPLANWDVSAVRGMNQMFKRCASLVNVSGLENWNTSAVTGMTEMFEHCELLVDISPLSNWDTSKVTSMYGTFDSCTSLADILPLANWNTSKVTCMRAMFLTIKSTATGDLSGWNVAAVTNHTSFCSASGVTQPNWTS